MSRVVEAIEDHVELMGFTPGTPEFEREVRKEKVNRCMGIMNVSSCTQCPRFGDCELRLAHWRDMALGPEHVNEVDEETVESPDRDLQEDGE